MNRHGIVNALVLFAFLAVLLGTGGVVVGSFYAPAATRGLVGTPGILVAIVVLGGTCLGFVVYGDRLRAWLVRRYELSDQP